MGRKKKGLLEEILYNNRFLMVLSVIVAIAVWATVKINYSEEITRSFSDVQITLTTNDSQGDYEMFVDKEDLLVSVDVTGKAYNLNQYALTKDDIIVEATSNYIDSAGYRVLNLTAKLADNVSGVKVGKVTPSTITVYFDRKTTGTFNVEAKLENDIKSIADKKLTVGQPAPSMNTVEVTGPTTILNKLSKVYFTAKINEEDLPVTKTTELEAVISYQLERSSEAKFLTCESVNEESSPATVTVPIYIEREVTNDVKFVNQPANLDTSKLSLSVSPKKTKILQNSKDDEILETLYVGTIDFSQVSNKKNVFEFKADEQLGVSFVNKELKKFVVTLDMSDMEDVTLTQTPGKVVLLNQDDNYTYTINYEQSDLNSIKIIGPRESIKKISAEDLQIEINVSGMTLSRMTNQIVEVSNISIQSEDVKDCWVYGKYTVAIKIEHK